MSVYDFNQHEHVVNTSNNNNVSLGNTNGAQVSRYQVDQDFINRSYATSHHMGMSVQLTRPTSKTAMLVRQRRAMLEQLSCYLCKGYLIDATTVDECMDSFCKSCIVIYLRSQNNCPKCGTLIHKTNPLGSIRSDKVLQDIVYKLVPGLYDDEMKRRREFYKGVLTTSSDEEEEDDDDDSSIQIANKVPNMTNEQYGIISHPKPFYKPTDSIDLSIEPHTKSESSAIYYDNKRQSIVTCFTGNQQRQPYINSMFSIVDKQQFKTYLRCPAKLTALQLKRFIAAKFNISKNDTIHLLYLNETVKEDYSLIDIAYIYDWRGIEHMRLYYIIERDLSEANDVRESPVEVQPRKVSLQNSVGTSTQTTKRVCIDPNPKFYEVNSVKNETSSSIRGTRSKVEQSVPKYSNVSNSMPQAPILRSSSVATGRNELGQQFAYISHTSNNNNNNNNNNIVHNVTGKELIAYTVPGRETRKQTQVLGSVDGAIDELSRLRQTKTKETRSTSRKNAIETDSIPKINISLATLNQKTTFQDVGDKTINTYSRMKLDNDLTTKELEQNNNIRHLVPFMGPRCSTVSPQIFAGSSHSTMVTVAGYTGIRSNHVMAIGTSSTSTVTSNHKNMIDAESSTSKLQINSTHAGVKNTTTSISKSHAAPQLAFKFVTEGGITMVSRIPNLEDSNSSTAPNVTTSSSLARVEQSSSLQQQRQQLNQQQQQQQQEQRHQQKQLEQASQHVANNSTNRSNNSFQQFTPTFNNHSFQLKSASSGTSTSSTSSNGRADAGPTARHLTKVKPVYKTFVDPTKLKSPNFKKLGYTARH